MTHPAQDIINQAIAKVNSYIFQINSKNQVYIPRISNVIHRWHSRKHYLDHLYHCLEDGIHPCDNCRQLI